MGRMYSDDIQSKLKEIDDYISEEYKLTHPKDKRDIRAAVLKEGQQLKCLIHEAVSTIEKSAGHPYSLTLVD